MRHDWSLIVVAIVAVAATTPALASSGSSLPWEGPLQQIQESITGPVAVAVSLVSVAVAGMMLAFGGEMNDIARVALRVTMVLGFLLGVTSIVGLYGATGASIGIPAEHAAQHSPANEGEAAR